MTIVRMFGGVDVDLINPDLSMVSIGSIFRTLSVLQRYNGQTCRPYTVLEHSLIGAVYLAEDQGNVRAALAFLMHDAHEAFIGDITTPVGCAAEIADQLSVLKSRLDIVIAERYNVDLVNYENEIRALDRAMFQREWRDLMWWRPGDVIGVQGLIQIPKLMKSEPSREYLLNDAMTKFRQWGGRG